jgi:hypothetical protein
MELLVVIAIIGLLVGLWPPAVQSARERRPAGPGAAPTRSNPGGSRDYDGGAADQRAREFPARSG